MLKKEELVRQPEYWMETIQNTLYEQVKTYMDKRGINQTELANELGVTKGYISQVLKGNFNYTIGKLIELSLAIGIAPNLEFISFEEYLEKEYSKINSGSVQLSNIPFTISKGNFQTIKTPLLSQFSQKIAAKPTQLDNDYKIA